MIPVTLLLLSSVPILCAEASDDAASPRHNLTFMLITSFGQFGYNSSGALPGADMALEDINNNSNILPGYTLVYDKVRDSQCHRRRSLDEFFGGILSGSVKLAVVGCGCSVATEPVAEISHEWNISQISYSSGLAALSDRSRFLRYFRNSPTFEIVSPALHSVMDHFKWRRIALLTQRESIFTGAELSFRRELEPANISVESRVFHTGDDPITTVNDFFLESEDYRVFILNCYSGPAKKIICEAARRGLTYPKYTWIAYDWYPRGWWKEDVDDDEDCDAELLYKFLERVISLRRYPAPDDRNVETDAGITPNHFDAEYTKRAKEGGFEILEVGNRLYDVIWVLAQALNNTMSMVENEDIGRTGCSNVTGDLVPLEEFNYTNEKMGCLIQWHLQQTNFSGGTGLIRFDENGTRIINRVRLRQYRFQGGMGSNLTRVNFAYVDRTDNYTFTFEPGFDDDRVYPSGVPLDGSPKTVIRTFNIGLVAVFDTLATLGIAFAVLCLLFNLIFRKRKLVKITSPNLNYVIILGAVLMYSSIYFSVLPNVNLNVVLARCILQHSLFTIGYSLAFGMALAKMWRIYQIFHNPSPNKSILKDWHLFAATMALTGITVVLLLLETSIPYLRGNVTKERDQEHPSGKTSLGVTQLFYVLVCYEASSPSFFWQIFLFVYLAVLQLVGIILSFQTRKVKVQGLRDSKFIATIIYISSIVLVILALVTFSLRTYNNIGTGIFAAGKFLLTTIFLALIFIPKMVLLYKDPDGDSLKEKGSTLCSVDVRSTRAVTGLSTFKTDYDPESKIAGLQNLLKERDDTIVKLMSDITIMKGEESNCHHNGKSEKE